MTWVFVCITQPYFPVSEAENTLARILFVWRCTPTYKQTHDVDYRVVIRGQNFTHMHARTFKHNSRIHTRSHIPSNKGPTVCGGMMNCLHCIIRMTHQRLINENRIRASIKEGTRRQRLKTKTGPFGRFLQRGHGANNLSKILHSQRIIMDKNNINNSSHALHVLRCVADFLRLRVINMYYKVTDGCLWVTTLFDL